MNTVNQTSPCSPSKPGCAPKSNTVPREPPPKPPPEDDLSDPQPGRGPEVSELEAKRQAALSSSFYHWVLSRL